MFAISLSSCSRYNANFKLDQSVSAIHDSPPYFWDQWGWPPIVVTHARDNWWNLDFANAFVSAPGVNSRGELIPSHGSSRRRLRDNSVSIECYNNYTLISSYISRHLKENFDHENTEMFVHILQPMLFLTLCGLTLDCRLYISNVKRD
jgi:hypothetical protein